MPNITEIDQNFKSAAKLDLDDVYFHNVKENPWCVFGLIYDELFRRMPQDIANNFNEGVQALHTNTSGGRIRFKTNSPYIAICAVMPDNVVFPHMPSTGVSGFDMYVNEDYIKTFIPPTDMTGGYEDVFHFEEICEREITIHFPLYNNVKDLYIGLQKGSSFEKHTPYINPQKIVYYGSSITQGGCVSRPGLAYPTQVSLKLNCDFINLGFSGSAKGEPIMAEYIAELNPDIFVMDYDHNAPTAEHLEKTHEKFFETFRSIRNNTPVIFLSAPNVRFHKGFAKRRDIVYRTYMNAKNSGDRNTYFIDGKFLWGEEDWRCCSVDCLHPNDMGHYRMAQNLIFAIKEIM